MLRRDKSTDKTVLVAQVSDAERADEIARNMTSGAKVRALDGWRSATHDTLVAGKDELENAHREIHGDLPVL